MRLFSLAIAAGVLVLVPASARAAVAASDGDASAPALGVAPFEVVAPEGSAVPELAPRLAERLARHGVARVVGPGELGAPAIAEPPGADVAAWAAGAGVAGVVVGRVSRVGTQLHVDAQLRRADGGDAVARYVVEIRRPELLERSVDALAEHVAAGAREHLLAAAPEPAPPAAAAPPASPERILGLDGDEPISIESRELEALQSDGARRLLFRGDVQVVQGKSRLTTDRLDAYYPAGSSQPSRLVAEGNVRLVDGDREARCDHATYRRSEDLLVCRGRARLTEGDDRVDGEVIEFDLAANKIRVRGGAKVIFTPDPKEKRSAEPGGGQGGR